MKYAQYLKTEHWQRLRAAVFLRDRRRCVLCKSPRRLNAHHWRYRRTWRETEVGDLVTLCEHCHAEVHRLGVHQVPRAELRQAVIAASPKRKAWIPRSSRALS